MSDQVAVLLKGVSKTFSLNGVRACDRVNLEIRRGETLILMGENGAGKSTLASLITGRILPDGGEIIHREKKGAGMVHQKPQVVEDFSVRDMVFGGNVELNRGLFISPGREREELIRIFEETGYDLQPEDLMGDLAPFQHQLTELAENLLMGKRVLILDEPEFPRIPELLAYLKQRGVTPLIITHRVEDALTLGDRIVMMGKGRIIMDRSGGDPGLREALLNNLLHGKSEQSAPTADLTTPSKGFIRVIAGHHESGLWDEEERLAREFLGKGDNGYIPSLNRRKAMEASWTVEENFMIHRRRNFAGPLGLIRKKALLTEGSVSLDRNGVTARPGDRMDHLSGGNQKKLLLLREFQRTGEKILLSEPSAALDRGNRDYLYDLIFKARKQGKEICLLTADPEEAFALGDEVVPLFRGKKGSPLRRGEYTLSRLVELMGGIGT